MTEQETIKKIQTHTETIKEESLVRQGDYRCRDIRVAYMEDIIEKLDEIVEKLNNLI